MNDMQDCKDSVKFYIERCSELNLRIAQLEKQLRPIRNRQAKLQLLLATRAFVGKYSEGAWKLIDDLMSDIERLPEDENT